ncbi:MAG: serine hydrolase [Planctomycetaceae bacterium]|nr:serine hydrolase [Planctomycetaceae bacterium]
MVISRRVGLVVWMAVIVAGPSVRGAELPASTPAAEGMSAEKLAGVGEVMNRLVSERHIAGGIVIVARHGKVVLHEPYGVMHLESQQPVAPDTIFRIYSMSKALTCAAAMVLVDEGKLELDAPVGKYLPELAEMKVVEGETDRPANSAITVTDLFLHTSGIPYGAAAGGRVEQYYELVDVLNRDSDLQLMVTKMGQLPLKFDPGTDWQYGASIDVLGRVVEVVSGQPLDGFLQQRIFAPLGMTDTAFSVPADKQQRFSANYCSDGQGRLVIRDEPTKSGYLHKPGLLSGGGGLVGTAGDYMRFLLMVAAGGQFDGQRILSADSIQLMTTNQVPDDAGWVTFGEEVRTGVGYGLGFSVTTAPDDANPHARQDEYGWGGAASTHYWVSPRDDLVVVTMEQRWPYSSETEVLLKPIIYDAIVE